MDNANELEIQILPYDDVVSKSVYDFEQILFDLDTQINQLSSHADTLDYVLAVASGLLCGAMDILWTGDFDLNRGRNIASDAVDEYVKKTAKMLGYEGDDLKAAVTYLEKRFPIPSDGNTPDFGGGLQHHLRDFAHHPTIAGLAFSLLTQFTYKSYGTDVNGHFLITDVPEVSRVCIGEDVHSKIINGTIIWFFHLVSDIAGSSSTAGKTGGTGIPGPILSLAKELSVLPPFKNMVVGDNSLSVFLSKLFNGTLLAEHDSNGKIIKDTVLRFDLRGELGVGIELGRQAVPVIANECIVRTLYFIRRFALELQKVHIASLSDFKQIDWQNVLPGNNPTLIRMLTISAGVFSTVDFSEAIISQKYWVAVNHVGVGRFAVAVGQDVSCCLKVRNVQRIKQMYEDMMRYTYLAANQKLYERIGKDMDMDKLGLTEDQTEILFNIEYQKTLNDILCTKSILKNDSTQELKRAWLEEWKQLMTDGYASFIGVPNALLKWYTELELVDRIATMGPNEHWFKLVLLEAMLFEPYYPLSLEQDKKGNEIPCTKYNALHNPMRGYKKAEGDRYLEDGYANRFNHVGLIKRFRKCYDSVLSELNEILKTVLTSLSITAVIAVVAIATAGAFAPSIAVALVGSNFTGLSGAALTSACLAYLGGGAVAVGGAGMAGGTIAIVGGGAALGLGVGAGVGGVVGAVTLSGKKTTIMQSAKLLVSIREIFLNDEHDLAYSNTIHEKYVQNIAEIEKGLVELRLRADIAEKSEKKKLKEEIQKAEESVAAMKIARKSMVKFISSFEVGMGHQ